MGENENVLIAGEYRISGKVGNGSFGSVWR
jgi:hypothetical protein